MPCRNAARRRDDSRAGWRRFGQGSGHRRQLDLDRPGILLFRQGGAGKCRHVAITQNVEGDQVDIQPLRQNGVADRLILQPEAGGEDVRAFVIDGKVAAAMKRKNLDEDEFRSNINLGGKGEAVELSKKEERAAVKAARLMHLSIAGVDLLRSQRGPLVMEVNAFPMLSGIEAATKVDIADKIIEYVEQSVKVKPKKDKVGA